MWLLIKRIKGIAQLISEGKQKKRLKTSTNDSGSARDAFKVGWLTKRLFHFGKNEPMGL
jgi:hypothetical protein